MALRPDNRPFTQHQQRHIDALIVDMQADGRRAAKIREATDIRDGLAPWPDDRLHPSDLHDYIENQDRKALIEDDLDSAAPTRDTDASRR